MSAIHESSLGAAKLLGSDWAQNPSEIVERYAWRTLPAQAVPPGDLGRQHAFEAWADELPGHVISAPSIEEALREAKGQALRIISRLLKDGKEIPFPHALSGRIHQVSLKLTAREAAEIDGAAASAGMSRSEYVRKAALDRVQERCRAADGVDVKSGVATWHLASEKMAKHRAKPPA